MGIVGAVDSHFAYSTYDSPKSTTCEAKYIESLESSV